MVGSEVMEGNVVGQLVQLQERQDEALRRHGDASVQAAVRQAMQEETRQLMEGLVARFVTGGEAASGVSLADTVATSADFTQAMEKVVQLLAHGAMVDNKGSVTAAAIMVGDEGMSHAEASMHGIADTRNEAACDAKQLLERFRADLLAQRQRSSNAGNDEAAVRRMMAQAGQQHGGGVSGQASAGMHTCSLLHAVCGNVGHAAGSEAASCPPYAVWEAALRQELTTMAEQAGLTQRAIVAVLDKLLADARLPLLRRQGTGPEAYGTALVQLVDDAFYAVQRRRLLCTLWVLTQQLMGHNDNGGRGSNSSEGCLPLVRPLFHVNAVWREGGKACGTIELSVAPTKMSDALLGLIRNDLTRYLVPEFTMAQLLKVGVTAKEGVRVGGGMPRDRMKGDTTVQHAMDALSELLVRCSLELTNALHEVQEAYKEVTTTLQQVAGSKKAPLGDDGEALVASLQALCHELRYGSLGGDGGAGLRREVVHGVVCLTLHDMVRAMYNATSKQLAAMQQQARQSSTMKGDMPPSLLLQHMTSAVSWEGLYHGPEGQQMLNELQEELKRRRMSSKGLSKYNAGLNPEKHIQLVLEEQRRSAAEPQMPKVGTVASPFPWSKSTTTPASMLYSTTTASPSASVTKGPTTTAKAAYTNSRGNYSATESDRYDAPITVENLAESRAALQQQQKAAAAAAKEQGSSSTTTMRGQQEVRRMPYEARQAARAAIMTGHDSSGRAEAAMPSVSQATKAVSVMHPAVTTRPVEGSKTDMEHTTTSTADKAMPASHGSAGAMQQEASSFDMTGSASAASQLPSGAVQHEAGSMAGDMAMTGHDETATFGTAAEATMSEGRDVAEEGMKQSTTGRPSMGSTYNERLEGLLRQYPFLPREPCPGVYLDEVPFEQNMRFSAVMNRLLMKKSSLTQRSNMSEVAAQERAVNDVVTELARELQQRTLETYLSMPFLDLRVHGVLLGALAQLFEEDGRFRALQLVRRQMIRSAAVTRGGNKQRVLNTEKCLREQAEMLASTLPGVEEERAARSVATLRAMAGNMAATTTAASTATSDSPSSDTLTPPATVTLTKDYNATTTTTVTHKSDSVTTVTPSATTTPEATTPEVASPNAAPTITATVTTTYRPPTRPDKATRSQGVSAGQPASSSTGTSVTRAATATSTSVAAATKQPVPQSKATTDTPVTGTMPTAATTTTPTTTTVTKAPSVTSVRSVQRKASDAVISVILPAEQYAVNANKAYDGPTVVSPQEAAPLDSTVSTKDTTAPRAEVSSDNGIAARPCDESSSPHTPQEPHARSGLRPPPHHAAPPQTPAATAAPPTNLARSSTRPPQPTKASATQQETASQTTVKAAQEKGRDTQPTTAGHPTSASSEPQAMSTSATADVPALSSSSSATKLPALTPASRDHSPLSTHSKAKSQGSTGSRNGHTPSLPSQRRPSSNCGRPAYTATMTISNKRTVPTVVTLSRPGDAKAKTIVTNAPVVLPTVSLSGQPSTTTTQPPASQLTPNALHEGQTDSISTRDATKPTAARDDGKESVADKPTSEVVPRRDEVAETTKAAPITAAAVSNEVEHTPLKDSAATAETTKVTPTLTPQPPTSSPLTKKPSSLYVADLSKSSVVITAHVPPSHSYPTTTNNNGQSPGTTPAPVRSLYTLATEEAAKRVAVYQQQQRSAAASPTANGQPRSDSQDSPSSRLRSPGHGTGAAMTMAEAARSVGQNVAATTTRTHLAGSTMMMMTDQTSYGSIAAAPREETGGNDNSAAMTTHAEPHTAQQQSEVGERHATGQRAEDMDAARSTDTANVAQQHLQQQQQADAARASVIAAWVQRVGQQARLSERPQSEPHELSRHREETWKSRTFGSMPSNAAHANSPAAVSKANTGNEATGEMARAMALTQPVSAPTSGGSVRPTDKSGSGSYGGGVLRSLTQAERQSVVPLFPEYRSRWTQSSRAEANNNNTDNNTTSYLPALLQRSQSRGFAYGTALQQQQHALNSPTTTVPRSPALDEVSCCSGGSVSFSQMQRSPQGGSFATDWRSTTSGQTIRGKVNNAARGRPSAEGNNNNDTEGGEAKTNYFRSSSPYEALLQQQNEQLTRNTAVGSKEAFLRRRSPASRVGTPGRFPDSPAAAAASEAASRLTGGDNNRHLNDTTAMSLNATNASMAATTATAGSTTVAAAAMGNNTTTSPPRSPRLAYHNSNSNGFAASTSISLGLPAAYLTTRPPLSFPLATTALSEVYTRACQELNMRPNSGLLRTFPSKPAVWLDKLDLSVNYVGNKGMRPILYVLEHNGDHLVLLNLSNNNLDNAEVLELIAVLAGAAGCNLATLDLSYNPFSQTAGQALLRLCTSRPNLTTIRIRGTLLPPKLMQAIEDQVEDNAFRKHLQQTS